MSFLNKSGKAADGAPLAWLSCSVQPAITPLDASRGPGLRELAIRSSDFSAADLAALVEAVRQATLSHPDMFHPLMSALVATGGVSENVEGGIAPFEIIERLRRSGVIEHVRLAQRERAAGRRYSLRPPFSGLCEAVRQSAAVDSPSAAAVR